MDFSQLAPEGIGYLIASLVAAVAADFAIVKVGLDFFKPASRYAFLVGRVGKLAALAGWIVFFNRYWFPEHLSTGQPLPGWASLLQWVILGAAALLAFTTYPRYSPAPAVAASGPQKRGSHV
jgi:hypothetical protein